MTYIHTSNVFIRKKIIATLALVAIVSMHVSPTAAAAIATDASSSYARRVAVRLQKRIETRFGKRIGTDQLERAVTKSSRLFTQIVTVDMLSSDGNAFDPWVVSLHAYPHWLRADFGSSFDFVIDSKRIEETIVSNPPNGLPAPEWSVITSVFDDYAGIRKAEADGIAKPGYEIDAQAAAKAIVRALESGSASTSIALKYTSSPFINRSDENLGELKLLATGSSDIAGSGGGRKHNVRKGMNEHLTNTIVPTGETFSFNSTLHNMSDAGWQEALGIFNGSELRPVRGGGICQVATTMYRSILNAGLPVISRAPHSLFVHYYEKFGVGIDATIYPKQQDLTFLNDTGHPILIQSYTEGDEGFVNLYGTPDGRVATLDGPFFSANSPAGFTVFGRGLKSNEIAWTQTIRFADGSKKVNTVYSRYKTIPRSVATRYGAVALAQ